MGGNQKANRTKGNAKPSSSGRSAELLANHGVNLQGFIGFSSQTVEQSFVPVTGSGFEDDLATIDGDLKLVMRKMTKRDVITKLKAIQQFSEICETKDIETLKAALPFWPRIFNRLSFDHDRRVREATHVANKVLVCKVGRNIAPYLKNLMETWFICTSDSHSPAATTALDSLKAAFPNGKFKNALIFCQEEIFHSIKENILCATPSTLSDPKVYSEEDMQSKYENIVYASFAGLKCFLEMIDEAECPKLKSDVSSLLEDPKFWKFSKFAETKVKISFFNLISTLCQKMTEVIVKFPNKACSVVFNNINCSAPVALTHIWEAALHIAITIADYWKFIDIIKSMIPQLLLVLKSHGHGSADTIYPMLWPLISRIPDEIILSKPSLFHEILEAILFSFTAKLSSSESSAIVKAYFEILVFALKKIHNLSLECNMQEFVKTYFIDVMLLSLTSNEFKVKPIFQRSLCELLFTNQCESTVKIIFWDIFYVEFHQVLFNMKPESEKYILDSFSEFVFNALAVNSANIVDDSENKSSVIVNSEESSCEEVKNCIKIASKTVLAKNMLDFKLIYVQFLSDIINFCKCKKIWTEIFGVESINMFINEKLMYWFKMCDASDSMPIVNLIFTMIPWIEETECQIIFQHILQNASIEILSSVFDAASNSNSKYVLKWLHGEEVQNHILWLTDCFLNENVNLQQCKSITKTLLSYLDLESQDVSKVMKEFSQTFVHFLEGIKGSSMDKWLCLPVLSNTYWKFLSKFEDSSDVHLVNSVFLEMMKLFFLHHGTLSDDLRANIIETCKKCKVNASFDCHGSSKQLISWFKLHLFKCKFIENIKEFVSLFLSITVGFFDGGTNKMSFSSESFIPEECEWKQFDIDTKLLFAFDAIDEMLLLKANGDDIVIETKELENLHRRLILSSYSLSILSNIMDVDERSSEKFVDVAKLNQYCVTLYNIILTIQIQGSPFFKNKNGISNMSYQMLENDVKTILQYFSSQIFYYFFKRSRSEGGIASIIFNKYLILSCLNKPLINDALNELISCSSIFKSQAELETLQVLIHNSNERLAILETGSNAIMKLISSNDFDSYVKMDSSFIIVFEIICETFKNLNVDDQYNELMLQVMQYFIAQRNAHSSLMMNNKNFKDLEELSCEALCAIIKLLMIFTHKSAKLFNKNCWDFLLCCLGDWIKCLNSSHSEESLTSFKEKKVLCHVTTLLLTVVRVIEKSRFTPFTQNLDLVTEWDEFFVEPMFSPILVIFERLINVKIRSPVDDCIIQHLASVLEFFPSNSLSRHALPLKLIAEIDCHDSYIPEKIQSLLNHFCPLLAMQNSPAQAAAFFILKKSVPILSGFDAYNSEADEESEERSPPLALMNTLKSLNDVIEIVLEETNLDENFKIDSFGNFKFHLRGYLLSWEILLHLFNCSSSEMKSKYASHLYESGLASSLLSNLLKLMPHKQTVLAGLSNANSKSSEIALFATSASLNIFGDLSVDEIKHLACFVYKNTLQNLPAIVRQWWNRQDKKISILVEKYTSYYVSGLLSLKEIESVASSCNSFGNMTIKTRPTAKEVLATYTIDEFSMELVIQLPSNHPLGPIVVESGHRVGVGTSQWRNWMLQLTTFLMHRNGSIVEGLGLWKKNVDKRFEGVEECMICFYVLHGSTCQLPKLTCRTCKKKYHSACLYKWFNTSNKSSCPLCRNLF